MGKSTERTNAHQDVTAETLTSGLVVTLETLTDIEDRFLFKSRSILDDVHD